MCDFLKLFINTYKKLCTHDIFPTILHMELIRQQRCKI
jgi:hypothetical protein